MADNTTGNSSGDGRNGAAAKHDDDASSDCANSDGANAGDADAKRGDATNGDDARFRSGDSRDATNTGNAPSGRPSHRSVRF